MKRWTLVCAALVLLIAACGGGADDSSGDDSAGDDAGGTVTTVSASDDGGASEETTPTTMADASSGDDSTAGSDTEDTEMSDSEGSAAVSGIGEASITINGETYLFGETSFPALRCEPNMFGLFWVLLQMVDDQGNEIPSGGGLELTLVPENAGVDEVTTASLDLSDTDQEWMANPDDIDLLGLEPGTSQVDSFTIDGNHVSGTATFYERNSYYAVQGGTLDAVAVAQGTFEATCAEG